MNVWRRACGLAVILSLFAAVGVAQDKKREAQLRTVRGVVALKKKAPNPQPVPSPASTVARTSF
jgi:hypothetical protein